MQQDVVAARRTVIAKKPAGNFQFITVTQLLMAWCCYQDGKITLQDLRVWFALHEMTARRCTLKKWQHANYNYKDELAALCAGRGHRASVKRLIAIGLVKVATSQSLLLASIPQELEIKDFQTFWDARSKVVNNRRRVPVPRRTIRFIAGGAKRGVVATVIGHLFRLLYYRNAHCVADGNCKASWIADVFGLDISSVKRARTHLIEIGWLESLKAPTWYTNRYGLRAAIKLDWYRATNNSESDEKRRVQSEQSEKHSAEPNQTPQNENEQETPPAFGTNLQVLPPPIDNQNLSLRRIKNQNPGTAPGQSGFYKSGEGKQGEAKGSSSIPRLKSVTREDLGDIERLLVLYEQAQHRGLISGCTADEINFVAAAEHARTIGTRNAPGLFAWLVRNKRYDYLTDRDVFAAHDRLTEYRNPEAKKREPIEERKNHSGVKFSEDALTVRRIRIGMRRAGYSTTWDDSWIQSLPGWDKERWDEALAELLGESPRDSSECAA